MYRFIINFLVRWANWTTSWSHGYAEFLEVTIRERVAGSRCDWINHRWSCSQGHGGHREREFCLWEDARPLCSVWDVMEETRKFTRLSKKSPDADVSSARERLPQITGLPGGGPAYTFLADNGSCMGMWFLCNVIFLEKYHFKVSPDFIKNPMWRDVEKVSLISSSIPPLQFCSAPQKPEDAAMTFKWSVSPPWADYWLL